MSLGLCLIFFLSGASALLFETLWFRLAGLTFGSSLWASSLVLAAFMAGLGLGNLLAVRYGPRLRRPLLTYASIEIVIGIAGYALVLLLPALTPALAPLFRPVIEMPLVLHALRLAFAFSLLLVPATAMGMTLPVLVRALTERDRNFGRVLGRLYGSNTLGAVAGALAGELFFIDVLGLRGTGLVAASFNAVAALASVLLATRLEWSGSAGAASIDGLSKPFWQRPGAAPLLGAAFLAGALLLALEVVWFRFLQLFVLGSSLIFAVMLSVILLGIGAGGVLASVWLGRRPGDHRYTPHLALAASILTALTYILFDDGFGLYGAFPIKPVPEPGTAFLMTLGLCAPVSVLSGILFTFLGRALGDVMRDETKASAVLTFANTLGAMIGSLLAGFFFIPVLGVERSVFLLGVTYGGVAIWSLGAGVGERARSQEERLLLKVAGIGAVLLFVFFPVGLMKNHYIPLTTRLHMLDGSRLAAMREGRTETAIYLRNDLWGQPRYFRLITNGFAMSASVIRSERYMSLFAYWPAALHPDPKKALLISYGVGITARALTEVEELESIEVVDISRTVLDLNREVEMFPDAHPLDDPRVRVHIEDGRFFLQTTPARYDIITGEPPPPKNAGIVNLYTKEYFQLLHDRLAPGGLATYWLPVYQLGLDEAKAITRAFCHAFSDCSLWTGAGMEWMLAGSRTEPRGASEETFARLWRREPSASRLRAIGVEAPAQMGSLFLADAPFLVRWTEDVPVLEDNYPHRISSRIDYYGRDYYPAVQEYERVMKGEEVERRFHGSEWVKRHWPKKLTASASRYFRFQTTLNRHFSGMAITVAELYDALESSSLSSLPVFLLHTNEHELEIADEAAEAGVVDPGLDYFRSVRAFSSRDYRKAAEHLAAALRLDPKSIELAQYRILALVLAGEDEAAAAAAAELRPRAPAGSGLPGFWEWWSLLGTAEDFGP